MIKRLPVLSGFVLKIFFISSAIGNTGESQLTTLSTSAEFAPHYTSADTVQEILPRAQQETSFQEFLNNIPKEIRRVPTPENYTEKYQNFIDEHIKPILSKELYNTYQYFWDLISNKISLQRYYPILKAGKPAHAPEKILAGLVCFHKDLQKIRVTCSKLRKSRPEALALNDYLTDHLNASFPITEDNPFNHLKIDLFQPNIFLEQQELIKRLNNIDEEEEQEKEREMYRRIGMHDKVLTKMKEKAADLSNDFTATKDNPFNHFTVDIFQPEYSNLEELTKLINWLNEAIDRSKGYQPCSACKSSARVNIFGEEKEENPDACLRIDKPY